MSIRWWNPSDRSVILKKILAHLKEDFVRAKKELAGSRKEFGEQFAETSRKLAEAKRESTDTKQEISESRRDIVHAVLDLYNEVYPSVRDILLDKLSPRVRQANRFWNTALNKSKQGELGVAINLLTEATDIFKSVGSVEKTMDCSADLFDLYIGIGREAEALTLCESLIQFLSGRTSDPNLKYGYSTIGRMFRSLDLHTKAIDYFTLARCELEKDGRKDFFLCDFGIAQVMHRLGKHDEAISLLSAAIESVKKEKLYEDYLGLYHSLLAEIYSDLNDHDKAAEFRELTKNGRIRGGNYDSEPLEASRLFESTGDLIMFQVRLDRI